MIVIEKNKPHEIGYLARSNRHVLVAHILSLDWHNRFLRNWKLKISNLYYIHYVKNSFHYALRITHYPLPITHYALPITHYALPITHYALRITHYALRITHYALRITHYPLPITDYPLPKLRSVTLQGKNVGCSTTYLQSAVTYARSRRKRALAWA